MSKKFHKPILIVLVIVVIYIGFNFKQLFLAPFYRSPIVDNAIDPTSVIFKNERFNGLIMCGEFNSKNRMGAYTGFERFISNPYKAYLLNYELSSDSSSLKDYWLSLFGSSPAMEKINFEIAIRNELTKNGRASMEENLWWDKQQRFDNMWYGICTNE